MVVLTTEVKIYNNTEDEMEITTKDIDVSSMLLLPRRLMVGIDGGLSSSSSSSSKTGINLHIPCCRSSIIIVVGNLDAQPIRRSADDVEDRAMASRIYSSSSLSSSMQCNSGVNGNQIAHG